MYVRTVYSTTEGNVTS